MQNKRTPVRRTPAMKSGTRGPSAKKPVVSKATPDAVVTAETPVVAAPETAVAAAPEAVVETPVVAEVAAPAFPAELAAKLQDSSVEVACDAADALAKLGDTRAVPALVAVLENADGYCHVVTRAAAAMALGKLNDPAVVAALTAAARDTMAEVSTEAVLALGELKAESAVGLLCEIVDNADGFYLPTVRHAAVRALGMLQAESARVTLETLAGNGFEAPSLVEAAREAVAGL